MYRSCDYCGEEFVLRRSDKRYCSTKCRVYFNRFLKDVDERKVIARQALISLLKVNGSQGKRREIYDRIQDVKFFADDMMIALEEKDDTLGRRRKIRMEL